MADKDDILALLGQFGVQKKSHILPFDEFAQFVGHYAQKAQEKRPSLAQFVEDTQIRVASCLEDLSSEQRCRLEYHGGKIRTVTYPGFFVRLLERTYADLASSPEAPFPGDKTLDVSVPSSFLRSIDVKKEFVDLLSKPVDDETELLRLNFPEDIRSIVVVAHLVKDELLELVLQRVRMYLTVQQNAYYMLSKLRSVFRGKEQLLKEMLNSVVGQRKSAMDSIQSPTEFTFSFWTYLANAVIKEYRDKTNKLDREHMYCQAAYLIGFYAIYFKGVRQKERNSAAAFKTLERRLRQTPYYFTVSEITSFKDDQGIPLTKKYTRDELHEYLRAKLKPAPDEAVAEVTRLKAPGGNEYYVRKEILLPLTLKKLHDASAHYRQVYVTEWMAAIEKREKVPAMTDDLAFEKDLFERIKTDDPILHALLSYELLYLTLQEAKPSGEIGAEISRILDGSKQKIVPLSVALKINRRELFNQAKMKLPFWKTVPFLNRLISFLKQFLSGGSLKRSRSNKRKAATAVPVRSGRKVLGSSPEQDGLGEDIGQKATDEPKPRSQGNQSGVVALQRAMARLKLEFAGSERLETSMDALIDKWNPLYDPVAKANLVEDVNSLVRDFLRKLKRGFLVKPPNAERIRTMAESLSQNHAFDQIKRKDDFKRYIELYMIKVLGGS